MSLYHQPTGSMESIQSIDLADHMSGSDDDGVSPRSLADLSEEDSSSDMTQRRMRGCMHVAVSMATGMAIALLLLYVRARLAGNWSSVGDYHELETTSGTGAAQVDLEVRAALHSATGAHDQHDELHDKLMGVRVDLPGRGTMGRENPDSGFGATDDSSRPPHNAGTGETEMPTAAEGEVHTKIICEVEDAAVTLSCAEVEPGHSGATPLLLAIKEVLYGRWDSQVCKDSTVTEPHYVSMVDATDGVRRVCQARPQCTFTPSQQFYGVADPLPRVLKYSQISFQCAPVVAKPVVRNAFGTVNESACAPEGQPLCNALCPPVLPVPVSAPDQPPIFTTEIEVDQETGPNHFVPPQLGLASRAALKAACCDCVLERWEVFVRSPLGVFLNSTDRERENLLPGSSLTHEHTLDTSIQWVEHCDHLHWPLCGAVFITEAVAQALSARGGDYLAPGEYALKQPVVGVSRHRLRSVSRAMHHNNFKLLQELPSAPSAPYVLVRHDAYVTWDGRLFDDHATYLGHPNTCAGVKVSSVPRFGVPVVDAVFILDTPFFSTFYHFMVEAAPKLVLFYRELKHHPGVLIHMPDKDPPPFVWEVLEFLGLYNGNRSRFVHGPLLARTAYMPAPSGCGRQDPFVVREYSLFVQQRLRVWEKHNEAPNRDYTDVVLVNRPQGGRYVTNMPAVRAAVHARWPRASLQELVPKHFLEGAAHFHRAALIVAPHGAGLSSMLFCRAGTVVVELLVGAAQEINICYTELAATLPVRYFGLEQQQAAQGQPMTVDVAALAELLKDIRIPALEEPPDTS